MTYTFRPARAEDCAAAAALINSAYRGESSRAGWTSEADLLGGQRTDEAALEELISSRSRTLMLAEDSDGCLAGCVLLERRPAGVAYLGMLTVLPALQGSGLGTGLLEWSETFVRREWPAAAIEMTVIRCRTELIAWYERRGYKPTGQRLPFPMDNPRFGLPKVADLEFEILRKGLV